MITSEQCLKWAEESGFSLPTTGEVWEQFVDVLYIEALCNRVRNETLEEAANIGMMVAENGIEVSAAIRAKKTK